MSNSITHALAAVGRLVPVEHSSILSLRVDRHAIDIQVQSHADVARWAIAYDAAMWTKSRAQCDHSGTRFDYEGIPVEVRAAVDACGDGPAVQTPVNPHAVLATEEVTA